MNGCGVIIRSRLQQDLPAVRLTAQGFDHFQVIIDLINFPDSRCTQDRMGQQPAPAIAVVSRTIRDAGQPHDQRRFDGILQKDRRVELLCPQYADQSEESGNALMNSGALVEHHLIHVR